MSNPLNDVNKMNILQFAKELAEEHYPEHVNAATWYLFGKILAYLMKSVDKKNCTCCSCGGKHVDYHCIANVCVKCLSPHKDEICAFTKKSTIENMDNLRKNVLSGPLVDAKTLINNYEMLSEDEKEKFNSLDANFFKSPTFLRERIRSFLPKKQALVKSPIIDHVAAKSFKEATATNTSSIESPTLESPPSGSLPSSSEEIDIKVEESSDKILKLKAQMKQLESALMKTKMSIMMEKSQVETLNACRSFFNGDIKKAEPTMKGVTTSEGEAPQKEG